jgi:hypothetical protein
VYLPSYSADLNPIEQAFSKIKNIPRKFGVLLRTHKALLEAMEGGALQGQLLLMPLGGLSTAVTRLRFSTYEYCC